MKRLFAVTVLITSFSFLPQLGFCGGVSTPTPVLLPTGLFISSFTASGGVGQVLISTPTSQGPFSTGYYTYITHSHVEMYAVAALSGGASPVTCKWSSGFVGNTTLQQLVFPTAMAIGTTYVIDQDFASPEQGVQAANYILNCPATTNVIWNLVVRYFQAS